MQLGKFSPLILALITLLCSAKVIIESSILDYELDNQFILVDAVVSSN